jgi:transcriptional regulator with XRE-family HTH domain
MGQLRQQFAKRLKELRKQKRMTQEDLAKASGLSISFVRSVEQGVNAPSFESIEAIASALHVNVNVLFEFETNLL